MTKKDKGNEKVAKKLKEMGVMPSENDTKSEEAVVEKVQDNKMPYALILTAAMFAIGIVGIVLSSGSTQEHTVSTVPAPTPFENRGMATNQGLADSAPIVNSPSANNSAVNRSMVNSNILAERRRMLQGTMLPALMSTNGSNLNHSSGQPAWFKEYQTLQLEQQKKMFEQQKSQQIQWQNKMLAQQRQWLNAQQRSRVPNMNVPRPVNRAPVYYNPNVYYQPAPYYGPRRY